MQAFNLLTNELQITNKHTSNVVEKRARGFVTYGILE
jgi:hypothetical protein